MDVPEEEPGRGRRGLRRGIRRELSNKRYVTCCIIEDTSHMLLIIHLLFKDGRMMEDAEDDN